MKKIVDIVLGVFEIEQFKTKFMKKFRANLPQLNTSRQDYVRGKIVFKSKLKI